MENSNRAQPAAPVSLRPVQFVFGVLGLVLTALIIWASLSADIGASFGAIIADPWGLVAIVDLYLGFFIFGVFVMLFDGVKPASFFWVGLLMVLGNILAVLWLVLRLPAMMARLKVTQGDS